MPSLMMKNDDLLKEQPEQERDQTANQERILSNESRERGRIECAYELIQGEESNKKLYITELYTLTWGASSENISHEISEEPLQHVGQKQTNPLCMVMCKPKSQLSFSPHYLMEGNKLTCDGYLS